MGRRLQVEWQETAEELEQLYRAEKHYQRRERLLTFWHLRRGAQIQAVAQMTGRDARRIRQWVAWYRAEGLAAVLRWVTGHSTPGVTAQLTAVQQKALVARVKLGAFKTVWDVMAWVKARWGIDYTYEGMRSVLKRHGGGLKVPRPQSAKADVAQQAAWQKKGFTPR
jgi:transposase